MGEDNTDKLPHIAHSVAEPPKLPRGAGISVLFVIQQPY